MIEEAIKAANKELEQNPVDDRITLVFAIEIPGGSESMFSLCNSNDRNQADVNYDKLECLGIWGAKTSFGEDSIYNDPATYKNFPGIKCLWVSEKIQKAADEAGIDWYEYWPELEKVEVYSKEN